MYFINHLRPNEWWRLDKANMKVYNYRHGFHYIDENQLNNSQVCEFDSWHELYLVKGFMPLQGDERLYEAWISPEGKFYDGKAHAVMAKYICDIIYGEDIDFDFAEVFLEERGWIRVSANLMWQVRFASWDGKEITQKQFDALWDWCECHEKNFPIKVKVKGD